MSNPFSPTPLGKDWIPPKPPEPPIEDDQETEGVLGALFDDAPISGADDSEQTIGRVGLGDLFGAAEEPAFEDTASGDDKPTGIVGNGLGDLFKEDHEKTVPEPASGENSPAVAKPSPTGGSETGSAIKPRVRRRGLLGVPGAASTDAVAVTTGQAEVTSATPAASAAAARTPSVERDDPTPRNQKTPAPGAAEMETRSTPSASPHALTGNSGWAAEGSHGPVGTGRTETTERGRRPTRRNVQENERLWVLVDQTLALIGADSGLQRFAQQIDLTQDLEVYARQRAELEAALRPKMASSGVTIGGPADIEKIIARVHDELSGISVLGDLWRDPTVDEILVDRWDIVNVERNGKLEPTDVEFRSPQHAEGTARSLALKISDRAVSRSIPLVTAELPGARVTFAFGAVVKGGLSVTIRKFKKLLELSDLLRFGSLNEEMVEFLRDAVHARGSVLVSGGTGTGKTTIINLLSTFIPDNERVITIEDAFELKLANTHVVSLQTKEASSSDDTVSVTLANLLRNTLRMRPDRIIVGEIREGEGAMVMLAAANTGHDGTITTIHANGVDAALNERLPDLVRQARANRDDLAIQRSIAGAFDLAIQITRGRSGRRYISEIAIITGVEKSSGVITTDSVFVGEETSGGVRFERFPIRAETEFTRRLHERGGDKWTR